MRIVDSKVGLGVVALCVVAWAMNAEAQNRCTSAKTKLAGKKAAAILKCYSKASLHGAPVDAACVQRARDKFAIGSQRADARQDPGNPLTLCPNGSGDAGVAESIVDVHVDDVAAELDPGFPSFALSQCTAKKLTCAGKKDAVILGCHAKALAKGLAVDPQCVSAAETKFLACYVKLEAKEVPPNPSHSNVCLGPDGDAGAIETKINGFAAQVVNFYTSSANGCPTALTFTATSNLGVLDVGWSGFGHDNLFIGDGAVTVSTSCSGTGPSCGVYLYRSGRQRPGEIAGAPLLERQLGPLHHGHRLWRRQPLRVLLRQLLPVRLRRRGSVSQKQLEGPPQRHGGSRYGRECGDGAPHHQHLLRYHHALQVGAVSQV